MALYVIPRLTPRAASADAIELRAKTTQLDRLGQVRALKILNGFAGHFLAAVPLDVSVAERHESAERLERAIARLRACGARRCVAFLERQREGTHG